ncbi:MAG TPA: hypothetical protein VMW27_02250, partial [Thermoanaerobaculia bacterium]|nr:hypothetical protein [Thermoanaerobaculia bacterium]
LLQERLTEGFRLLFEVVRRSRRCGNDHSLPLAHLNLCFGYQELRRFRQAFRHGLRALELAERSQEEPIVKNALYLLGETANLRDDVETASRYFERLWREHYPEATYLPQLLLAVDVRKMINLLA